MLKIVILNSITRKGVFEHFENEDHFALYLAGFKGIIASMIAY